VFFCTAAVAQQKSLDSLKNLLAVSPPDTIRCSILNHILEVTDGEEYERYANELKELAEEKIKTAPVSSRLYREYTMNLCTAYNAIAMIARYHGEMDKSLEYQKKSLKMAELSKDREFIAHALNNMGTFYIKLGDTTNTFKYIRASLEIMKEQGNKGGAANALNNLAVVYKEHGNPVKALECNLESIRLWKESGEKKGLAGTYNNIGQIYSEKGDVLTALDYFSKSEKLFRELNNKKGTSYALANLAKIYLAQGDTLKAIEYNQESLNLKKMDGDSLGYAKGLTSLGYIYFIRGQNEKALDLYMKSLKVLEAVKDQMGISNSYRSIAAVYFSQGKPDDALELYEKSLAISEKFDDKAGASSSLTRIGEIYFEKGQKEKSLQYALRALEMGKQSMRPQKIKDAAEQLHLIYKSTGNYQKSLENYELYVQIRDSLSNEETKKAVLKNQLQYEYEKKELLAKNENEKKIAAVKLDSEKDHARKNVWIVALILVSVLLLAGAFFLFNYFRQKSIIADQKANILKQKLLVSQMNPHFIFNSLNAIQNYIFKQDSLKAGIYLSQFAELIRMILDYSRRDLISLDEEIKLLTNYFELQQLRFENKFDYTLTVSEEIDTASVQIPPMLAQPFIENAIEHGIFYKEGRGTVKVKISRKDEKLLYEIEDDGVGLERSLELNKTAKAMHKSLATIITKERMESIKSSRGLENAIEVTDLGKNSPGGSGVKVTFTIPFKEI
jgi:tetratricopeptide (TPR) repeat protein